MDPQVPGFSRLLPRTHENEETYDGLKAKDDATQQILDVNEDAYSNDIPVRWPLAAFRARWLLSAWQLVLGSGALTGVVVLAVNVTALIVVWTHYSVENDAATIYTGSCSTASHIVTGLHLVINVLSTVLLASSNFSMQCLSSPTRAEVDNAHAEHRWLSIATSANIRNLRFVSRTKAILWLLLGLSSFPLHLLWNSTVFQSLATNEYVAISARPNFLHGAPWSIDLPPSQRSQLATAVDRLQRRGQEGQLERLNRSQCVHEYYQQMQSERRNVILVVDDHNINGTLNSSVIALYYDVFLLGADTAPTYTWMTNGYQPVTTLAQHWVPGPWPIPFRYVMLKWQLARARGKIKCSGDQMVCGGKHRVPVKYCLSETVEERCKVGIVPTFLMIVIACNTLKIVGFLWTLHISRRELPLLTTGDTVASFIAQPDTATRGRCLAEKMDYQRSIIWFQNPSYAGYAWKGSRSRWVRAVQTSSWLVLLALFSIAIIVGFLIENGNLGGLRNINDTTGFAVNPDLQTTARVGSSGRFTLLTAALTANIPQIVATYLYMALNNMLTSMLAMEEWTRLSRGAAKGLRVSKPKAGTAQRKTYFLSVPFRWSVPFIATFAMVHWSFSEMLSLLRIDVYGVTDEVDTAHSVTTVYLSKLTPVILGLAFAPIIAIILLALCKRFPAGSTLAGCCSASIAAACQPAMGEDNFEDGMEFEKLRWGVTEWPTVDRPVGHATFTNSWAGKFIEGLRYA